MGHEISKVGVNMETKPEYIPPTKVEPTFDPQFGFELPRKKKEVTATPEEVKAFKLSNTKKNYCAHLFMELETCKLKNWPMGYNCAHQFHHYHHCLQNDYLLRMKEYEREMRLRKRQMILDGKLQA